MVKKVKRFIIFVLFSFFYTLLSGKTTEAKPTLCIIPKASNGKLFYQGNPTNHDISPNWCSDY